VAVVDDEPMARACLGRLLEDQGCMVAGAFHNARALRASLDALGPLDALFLDIQLPGLSGLELMDAEPRLPPVVVVSASGRYALEAFEKAAVDYLKKPVREERIRLTLDRLRELKRVEEAGAHKAKLLHRFPVRGGEGSLFMEFHKTSHFEVENEVVWAWVEGQRFRTSWTSLAEVESQFAAFPLIRIQRHILIRPDAVVGFKRIMEGRMCVRMGKGLELPVSRAATPHLRSLLGV
jgi:two-component system LytT family response regulator